MTADRLEEMARPWIEAIEARYGRYPLTHPGIADLVQQAIREARREGAEEKEQENERLRAEADGERARRRELEAVGREESKDRARLSDQLAEARAYLMDLKVRACEPCPHAEENERLRAYLTQIDRETRSVSDVRLLRIGSIARVALTQQEARAALGDRPDGRGCCAGCIEHSDV